MKTCTEWDLLLEGVGPLAEFLPQDVDFEPSKGLCVFKIVPFADTIIIFTVGHNGAGYYANNIQVLEAESEYPPELWMRYKRVKTAQEAIDMARQQDGV